MSKIVIKYDEATEMIKFSGMPQPHNGVGNYCDYNVFDWMAMIKSLGYKYGFEVEIQEGKIKI